MSVEENKALVRRFVDKVWSEGDLAAADDFISRDFLFHTAQDTMPHGLEGFKENAIPFKAGFPDARYTILEMLADGDRVIMRSYWTGTHQNAYRGIPPTGNKVTVSQINIFRIVDGKIAERWVEGDILGMMEQLGVIRKPY